MSTLANVAVAGLLVVAATMAIVAARAATATRSPRLSWVAAGFTVFLVKGALLSYLLFTRPAWQESAMIPSIVFDVVALASFYIAIFRRS